MAKKKKKERKKERFIGSETFANLRPLWLRALKGRHRARINNTSTLRSWRKNCPPFEPKKPNLDHSLHTYIAEMPTHRELPSFFHWTNKADLEKERKIY
jgi:hypothetical protein